jgi:hypothetical protein
MMRVILLRSLFFVVGSLFAGTVWTAEPLAPVAEHELKAAYLYNFAVFTTWPTERSAQEGALNFCVYAGERQAASLGSLQGRKIRERSIQVRQVLTPAETIGCHVLFVGGKSADEAMPMLEAVRDSATLSVTDAPDMAPNSAVISMALDRGKLAFDVNLQNARRARLVLSSKLLNLARSAN